MTLTWRSFSEWSTKPKIGCVVRKISKYGRIQVFYQKRFVLCLDTSVLTCFVSNKYSSHPFMGSYRRLLFFLVYRAKTQDKCCFLLKMLICSVPERCAEVFTIIQPLFIAKITFQTFVGCVSKLFQKLTDVCESISKFWKNANCLKIRYHAPYFWFV